MSKRTSSELSLPDQPEKKIKIAHGKDEKVEKTEEKQEEKYLTKRFSFTVQFSEQDKDLFDKFDRPEKLRELHRIVRTIYQRMFPDWNGEKTIDHADRNIFNNTRSNLRLATALEQIKNRRKLRNNQSSHTGVSHYQRRKKSGRIRHNWRAKYKKEHKYFPFNEAGLTAACEYYRKKMVADGSTCDVCDEKQEIEEMKIDEEPNVLSKQFEYEVIFSWEDRDLLNKWTRADDARHMGGIVARKIAERIGLKPTSEDTVDHINQNYFDQRRGNFRLATQLEQNRNKKVPQTNTSGHLGVTYKHNTSNGHEYDYWVATYKPHKGDRKVKYFAYTEQGLKDACLYYRTKLRTDKTTCPTCFAETV